MNHPTFERPKAGKFRLALRASAITPSAVREILKVAERPDVVSFAGGLPAPELFPVHEIGQAYVDVLATTGASALQYGITEGFVPLREWIAGRLAKRGVTSSVEKLVITNGSQQGIDLVARVLLDPGDTVLVENPTYLAALQAFASYQVKVVALPSDDQGMKVELLEDAVKQHRPRLIYIVPEFQNPKGISMAATRRQELVRIARKHRVPVLEDDPHGELRFRGKPSPSLAAMDPELDTVLQLGTFSKTLAPGLRIGWIHGAPELLKRITVAKQACDLHTATLAQHAAAKLLQTFDYDGHLEKLRKVYGERCDKMAELLHDTMPPGTHWALPEGGLFFWVGLPHGVRDRAVFDAAIRKSVAVVPGSGFFIGSGNDGFIRLNYSNQTLERIETGMARLGQVVSELALMGGEEVEETLSEPSLRIPALAP